MNGAVFSEKLDFREALEAIDRLDREGLGFLQILGKVFNECGALPVGGREDVDEQAHKETGCGNVDDQDAQQATQAQSDEKAHQGLEQKGENRCHGNGYQ